MSAPAGALCATHPEHPALHICTRCGSFVCIDCLVTRDSQPFCFRCVPRTLRDASWLAISSAILGFFSLGCGPLGLIAILLGGIDLIRVAVGRAPRDGAKLDAAGIGFGFIGLVLGAVIAYRLATGAVTGFDPD